MTFPTAHQTVDLSARDAGRVEGRPIPAQAREYLALVLPEGAEVTGVYWDKGEVLVSYCDAGSTVERTLTNVRMWINGDEWNLGPAQPEEA